jgi:PTH1 family peptidyl-tRNA hydrolase
MAYAWKDAIGRLIGVGSLEMKKGASMKLIVGLGNADSKYDQTRHNVGFRVVDALAERFGAKVRRKKFNALTEEIFVEETKLLLLKPQQYMNRSGHAVATAAGFHKLSPADILVVTDDMALDVGRLRLRAKGSAGGHNGLKDIIARLGSSADERDVIDGAVRTAVDVIYCWLRDGVDLAMTRYNVKNGSDENGTD